MMKNFAIIAVFILSFAAYSSAQEATVTLTQNAKDAATKISKGDLNVAAFSFKNNEMDLITVGDKTVVSVKDIGNLLKGVKSTLYALIAYDCKANEEEGVDVEYNNPKPIFLIYYITSAEDEVANAGVENALTSNNLVTIEQTFDVTSFDDDDLFQDKC